MFTRSLNGHRSSLSQQHHAGFSNVCGTRLLLRDPSGLYFFIFRDHSTALQGTGQSQSLSSRTARQCLGTLNSPSCLLRQLNSTWMCCKVSIFVFWDSSTVLGHTEQSSLASGTAQQHLDVLDSFNLCLPGQLDSAYDGYAAGCWTAPHPAFRLLFHAETRRSTPILTIVVL